MQSSAQHPGPGNGPLLPGAAHVDDVSSAAVPHAGQELSEDVEVAADVDVDHPVPVVVVSVDSVAGVGGAHVVDEKVGKSLGGQHLRRQFLDLKRVASVNLGRI